MGRVRIRRRTQLTASEQALLDLYWSQAEAQAHYQYDGRYALFTSGEPYGSYAYDQCTEYQDGVYVYWWLSTRPEISESVRAECLAMAIGFVDFGLTPAYIQSGLVNGVGGWHLYVKGLVSLASDARVSPEKQAQCILYAETMAFMSPYSKPWGSGPEHTYWPLHWQCSSFSREWALSILAHLHVYHLNPDDAVRDQFLVNILDQLIFGRYFPWWLDTLNQGYAALPVGIYLTPGDPASWTEGRAPHREEDPPNCYFDFLMLMNGHLARSLITYYESDHDNTFDSQIVSNLTALAQLSWQHCSRTTDGYTGLFYVSTGDGLEPASGEMSGLCMPWYAWLYSITGNTWYRDRAIELFDCALHRGWYYGLKHFNQIYLWTYEGLQYINMV